MSPSKKDCAVWLGLVCLCCAFWYRQEVFEQLYCRWHPEDEFTDLSWHPMCGLNPSLSEATPEHYERALEIYCKNADINTSSNTTSDCLAKLLGADCISELDGAGRRLSNRIVEGVLLRDEPPEVALQRFVLENMRSKNDCYRKYVRLGTHILFAQSDCFTSPLRNPLCLPEPGGYLAKVTRRCPRKK